mgnify:CR=1 FL=1
MIKEKEAMKKQCCMPFPCGQRMGRSSIRYCSGSDCMAWVFDTAWNESTKGTCKQLEYKK